MKQVTEQVTQIVRRYLPAGSPTAIGAEENLADLGLGSLGVVGVITDLEAAFSVRLPDYLLVRETFSTIQAIAGHITELVDQQSANGPRGHS